MTGPVQPGLLASFGALTPPQGTALPEVTGFDSSVTVLGLLNTYAPVFIVAFLLTVVLTPIVRRIALAANVIDHPDEARKTHRAPVAYLGGLAVFCGLLVAIAVSFFLRPAFGSMYAPVPMAVIVGMVAITLTGFADDVWGWDPRLKIAGQLVAAAALAIEETGVRVADGLLSPVLGSPDEVIFALGGFELTNYAVIYWVGTALIAIFVIGGCNSANLIDGLDGLLSGVVAIVAIGLLAICLLVATVMPGDPLLLAPVSLDGARIVLCLALLGAVLGFLPHNFNPATIFLGDCGSLLLGYMCVVIILMLGEQGYTHLVLAGLIVFAVPITDTVLAIFRRKLTGRSMSAADSDHLHHVLLRMTGSVKRAVISMYGFGVMFAMIGVGATSFVLLTEARARVLYAVALVVFGFIGAIGLKSALQARARLLQATEPVKQPRNGKRSAEAGVSRNNGASTNGDQATTPPARSNR